MVEQVGSGIGRIQKDLEKLGLPAPIYKTDGLFTVVFQRSYNIENKTTVKTTVKILELVKLNNKITRKTLAETLGMTIDGIDWNLKKLKQQGLLKRIGSDKGGHWEVINE